MANQNLSVRFAAEALRTLAFGSISSSYAALGTALANPSRQIMIVNTTDSLLTFSLDGVTDHFVLPSGSQFILDVSSNMVLPSGTWMISKGLVFYVKGGPGSGSVYLSTFYGSNL